MSVRMIRELRAEVSRLHTLLGHRWVSQCYMSTYLILSTSDVQCL